MGDDLTMGTQMNTMTGSNSKCLAALALTAALSITFWSFPTASISQGSATPSGTVAAIQGEGQVILEDQEQEKQLQTGDIVQAWNAITSGENSRVYLQWDSGVATSLGDFSSIFLSPEQTPTGETNLFQIIEGIVRVTAGPFKGSVERYSVATPVALIEPTSPEQTDFIVEVYDPSTTVLTVLAGSLKVTNVSTGESTIQTVSGCQSVYIEQAKTPLEVVPSSSDGVGKLIGQTTIPGTVAEAADPCAVAGGVQPAPPAPSYVETMPPPADVYPPEYYVQDWDEYDYYPYDEITVLPPRPGVGCVIMVPGIGEYVIPLSYFGDWIYDPGLVAVWARRFFLERVAYYDWDYLRDLRARKRHLQHLMYLAQLGRNPELLHQARRELDSLNLRSNWLQARLHRLEGRVAGLQSQERNLTGRLPRGLNLDNAMTQSFTSRENLQLVDRLQRKLKTDLDVQNRLVNIAGNDLTGLRSQLAREKDPQKRLALRNGLTRFRNEVAEGKLPISPKQSDLRNLVTQLSKEKNPASQEQIQKQLLGRLDRTEAARMPEALDPKQLAALKQDLSKFRNPGRQRELENQFNQLQQSVQMRNEAEINKRKAEELVSQAAVEKNPEKQNELIGKLHDLSTPLAIIGGAAAGAGAMKLLQQRQQHLEQQVIGEKDREKKAVLQQSLEELKKRQSELQKQGPIKPQELQRVPTLEPQRKPELRKQDQLELRKKEQEERFLQQQQQRQERERQLQLQKQPDRGRQLQQQPLKPQDLEQRRIKEQEQLRLKGEQDKERLRLQQQDREKQLQQQRLKQQDQEKLLQQRRLEQEQLRKSDELKKQQQLRLQQDRERQQQQQQQQFKLQQEKSRQDQLRMQQERGRQEQLKQQQDQIRQQQLKQQQDQIRQQQLKQQQDQARQQQLKQQQEQQRLQRLKEEQDKLKKK
jgi:hypothetical protein